MCPRGAVRPTTSSLCQTRCGTCFRTEQTRFRIIRPSEQTRCFLSEATGQPGAPSPASGNKSGGDSAQSSCLGQEIATLLCILGAQRFSEFDIDVQNYVIVLNAAGLRKCKPLAKSSQNQRTPGASGSLTHFNHFKGSFEARLASQGYSVAEVGGVHTWVGGVGLGFRYLAESSLTPVPPLSEHPYFRLQANGPSNRLLPSCSC